MRYATHLFTAIVMVLGISLTGCNKDFCTASVSWTDEFVDEEGRILLPVQVEEVVGKGGNTLAQNSMEARLMRVDSQGRAFEVASRIDVAFGVLGDISAYPIYENGGSKDLLPIGYITPGGMPMQQFGLGGHAVPSGQFQIVSWTNIVQQFPSAIIGNVLVALTDVEIVRPDFGARLAALFTVNMAGQYQIEVDGLASPVAGSRVIASLEFPFQWTSPVFNLNPSGSTPGEGEGEGEYVENPDARGQIDIQSEAGQFEGPGVYIDPFEHNDLRDLFFDLPTNSLDQIGVFCWFPEFPELNGTPLTRAFENKPVVIPLAPIYGLAPQGATVVAFAVFGFDRDNPNQNIPDWVGDAFTTGYPYWAKIWKWDIALDGEVSGEATGSHGQGLGYVLIPIPNSNQQPEQFTLTTSVVGQGTVSGAGTYDVGTEVNVSASAATGWHFDHWTVNGTTGNSNPGTLVMDGDVDLVGYFVQNTTTQQFTLTTSVVGQGTVSGAGTYDVGTEVNVSASAATGWHFDHWTVNGTTGNSNPGTLVMDGDVALVAYFVQDHVDPPVSTAPIVEFTRSGSTGTMRIFTDALTLREITADASAAYLPVGATFADISAIGVEIVNLPSPYWYLRESSAATVAASSWSTTITLDGVGTDSAGVVKTVAMANWVGGRAIPYYTIASVPGRIFSLNTGMNSGTINDQALAVDTTGFIWPAS